MGLLKCYLLSAANVAQKATQWLAAGLNRTETMDGIPLGDAVGDGSGEIFVKVGIIANGGTAGGILVSPFPSQTATRSQVAAAAVDTLLLASNSARKGATIYNSTDKVLHVSLGTVAATVANSTIPLALQTGTAGGGYYEVPANYIGMIRGIWDAAPTGAAKITELT